jgi:hypothetical protein
MRAQLGGAWQLLAAESDDTCRRAGAWPSALYWGRKWIRYGAKGGQGFPKCVLCPCGCIFKAPLWYPIQQPTGAATRAGECRRTCARAHGRWLLPPVLRGKEGRRWRDGRRGPGGMPARTMTCPRPTVAVVNTRDSKHLTLI